MSTPTTFSLNTYIFPNIFSNYLSYQLTSKAGDKSQFIKNKNIIVFLFLSSKLCNALKYKIICISI